LKRVWLTLRIFVFQEEFAEMDMNKDGVIDQADVTNQSQWHKENPFKTYGSAIGHLHTSTKDKQDKSLRLARKMINEGKTRSKTVVLLGPLTSPNPAFAYAPKPP